MSLMFVTVVPRELTVFDGLLMGSGSTILVGVFGGIFSVCLYRKLVERYALYCHHGVGHG